MLVWLGAQSQGNIVWQRFVSAVVVLRANVSPSPILPALPVHSQYIALRWIAPISCCSRQVLIICVHFTMPWTLESSRLFLDGRLPI
jgi:hypothetical protein